MPNANISNIITVYFYFLRHPPHNNNVVVRDEYDRLVELGRRLKLDIERNGLPFPSIWRSSPLPRAITAGIAICEGVGRMLKLDGSDPELGDASTGDFPFTADEMSMLKTSAASKGVSIEKEMLTHPDFESRVASRGAEGANKLIDVAGALVVKDDCKDEVAILISTHGGRIEPVAVALTSVDNACSIQAIEDMFPEPVGMGTLTTVVGTYNREEGKFYFSAEEVHYEGTLEASTLL